MAGNALAVDDDDLIQIIDGDNLVIDGPAPVEKKPAAKPERTAKAVAPEDAIDAIKQDLANARQQGEVKAREADEARRALEAEKAARAKANEDLGVVRDQALRERWRSVNAEHQDVVNSIAAHEAAIKAAERDLDAAYEAGKGIGAANTRLSTLVNNLGTLQNGKIATEAEIKTTEQIIRRAREAVVAEPAAKTAPETPVEPVKQSPDQWIGEVRGRVGDKAADWLSEHKEFVTDPKLHKKLLKFADYFENVEEKSLRSADFVQALNSKFFPDQEADEMADEELEPEVEAPKPQQKRTASAPAAPVSRNASPSQPSSNNGAIKLTQDEYNVAPDIYGSYEDLSPETKKKFPAWSPTAARWQYNLDKQRAQKDNKYRS